MIRTSTIFFAISLAIQALSTNAFAHGDFEHAMEDERKHHFALAEDHLRRLINTEPDNAQAWLSLASLETVRGHIDAARRACAQATRQVDAIESLACRGRIALADAGDKARALAELKPLLDHPAFVNRRDPVALWTVGVAAELSAAVGAPEETEQLFRRSLAVDPPVHLDAAYLDFLLSANRPGEVLEYVARRGPELALELRRALALVALGELDELHGPRERLHRTFLHWMEDGDFTHGREMAMFYLDVFPQRGLATRAATENLKYQREPEDRGLYARVVRMTE